MYVHSEYMVYHGYSSNLSDKEINIYTMYIQIYYNMVRRMIATITQIESVVTPSGNSGHV
jgi:hypothetical protein